MEGVKRRFHFAWRIRNCSKIISGVLVEYSYRWPSSGVMTRGNDGGMGVCTAIPCATVATGVGPHMRTPAITVNCTVETGEIAGPPFQAAKTRWRYGTPRSGVTEWYAATASCQFPNRVRSETRSCAAYCALVCGSNACARLANASGCQARLIWKHPTSILGKFADCSARTAVIAASALLNSWPWPPASTAHGHGMTRPNRASQRPLSMRPMATKSPGGKPKLCSAARPACSQSDAVCACAVRTMPSAMRPHNAKRGNRYEA